VEEERTRLRDAWLPGLLVVIGAAELALLGAPGWAVAVGLQVVAGLLLVFRRRYPLAVGPVSCGVLLVMPWIGPQLDQAAAPILFFILAIFSLARWVVDLRGVAGLVAILGFFFIDYAFVDARIHDWTDVVFVLSLAVPPYLFGRIVRRLEDQRRLLAAQQEVIRDQAVARERERIARELHDVLAHSLSAMVVQTAAAQDLLKTSPDRAAGLLQSVADTGRAALEETGRLLHLIRDAADELGLHPAPGLRDVPVLVETFRAGGLLVEAQLDLPVQELPGGVDVSAYRVVQELLTNALRYADAPVDLVISSEPHRLRISCANPLGHGAQTSVGSGLGLQGLAERVALLGGTVKRGNDTGQFTVSVDIPLTHQGTP
jgi:signal transduction histidine kinase